MPIARGATSVFLPAYSIEKFVDAIARYDPHVSALTPKIQIQGNNKLNHLAGPAFAASSRGRPRNPSLRVQAIISSPTTERYRLRRSSPPQNVNRQDLRDAERQWDRSELGFAAGVWYD